MDFGAGLAQGFALLVSPSVLVACAIGLMAGIFVGFLPGISALGGLVLAALLLVPLQVTAWAVFMVSFAYGALYGRGLAAINQRAAELGKLVAGDLPNLSLMIFGLIAGVLVAGAAGRYPLPVPAKG